MGENFFKSISILTGTIIGAGFLALPYAVSQAGFLSGAFTVLVIGVLCLMLNLYIGEVALRTNGHHQLIGYAEKYLGWPGRMLMLSTLVAGIYGATVAYTTAASTAINNLIGLDTYISAFIFFAFISLVIYFGIEAIAKSDSITVPAALLIIFSLLFIFMPSIKPQHLTTFDADGLTIPFGIALFSFIGITGIPAMKEELKDKRKFRLAITIASVIPIFAYLAFCIAIVGVMGPATGEIAFNGLEQVFGPQIAIIGYLLALITITTSTVTLGLALKQIFVLDLGLAKNTAWVMTCLIPFKIFLVLKFSSFLDFTGVLAFTGVLMGVVSGSMVMLMAIKARSEGDRAPEYSMYLNRFIVNLIIALLVLGGLSML